MEDFIVLNSWNAIASGSLAMDKFLGGKGGGGLGG